MTVENNCSAPSISLRSDPSVKATLIKNDFKIMEDPEKIIFNGESLKSSEVELLEKISGYNTQLTEQGAMKQSMVIRKGDEIVGSIGENNWAIFQDSSINNLWNETNGDIDDFSELLKQNGYTFELYENGEGPAYSEIHEQIHGEKYSDLITRQTTEFYRETLLHSDAQSFFHTIV